MTIVDRTRLFEFPSHPLDDFWRPFDPEWLDWLAPAIRDGQVYISIEHQAAAPHLVGHPLVFRRSTDTPLRVQSVRGRLAVTPRADGCRVTFELPKPYAIHGQFLEILQLNDCESSLIQILGKGLPVPAAGQEQLGRILRNLSDQVLGDLPADPDLGLQEQLRKALGGS